MKLTLKPIQASPEFIRDNQYNTRYKVIDREWDRQVFDQMIVYHGECRVMHFPSGKECFFCEIVVDKEVTQ